MLRQSLRALALVALVSFGMQRCSGGPPAQDTEALSARIDELIGTRLAKEKIPPAPAADDTEFFRRLSLDLNGRIPSLSQLADFLDDARTDKRRQWIDELLDGSDYAPLYVRHFTHFWRRQLLALTPAKSDSVVVPLEGWLSKQVKMNTPYDRLMRGLLTDPEAVGFFLANQNKPENLASRTTRMFLGIKLECAQCHDDRSGGSWKRAQFWEFAAFFTGLGADQGVSGVVETPRDQKIGAARIRIGDSAVWAEARFLDGSRPNWQRNMTTRQELAEWIARGENPWFARAAVNRLWQYFFGRGLVDPVDGFAVGDNPPSHPKLLDELARQFVAHDFDLKYMIRAITGSEAYQRSSRVTDSRQAEPRLFARAASRVLTDEQLYDSLVLATGYRHETSEDAGSGPIPPDLLRAEFLASFDDDSAQPLDYQASIQQALLIMNGRFIDHTLRAENSATLSAVIRSKQPLARRIEELYRATLSRPPRRNETQRLVDYAAARNSEQAMRDILWSLVNSTEFILNH
jgi:hypothetical protein